MSTNPKLSRAILALTAVAVASMAQSPIAAADQRVGINSAVNPTATGTPTGGSVRQLMIGQDVVFKERVTTLAGGQTQIVFLDESAMSVGPNSDLVIDEFVYDPRANSGKLAMSATRGVFRYVGGKISKLEGGVQLMTPVASIGIRGGVFTMSLVDGQLDVVFLYGYGLALTSRTGQTMTVVRPGSRITVDRNGNISGPYAVSQEFLASLSGALDGRPGGNGGAMQIPTDQQVAATALANELTPSYSNAACPGSVGLRAVAGRLTVRCDAAIDPGDLQSVFLENEGVQRRFTPLTPVQPQSPVPIIAPPSPITSSPSPAAPSPTVPTGALSPASVGFR